MTTQPIQFKKVNDVELWLLNRPDYCLPAFVQRVSHDQYPEAYLIWPASELMYDQMTKFYEELEWKSIGRRDRQLLLKDRQTLEAVLTKAQGVTPDFYYRWSLEQAIPKEDDEVDVRVEPEQAPSADDDRFLREVLKQTQIVDIGTLKLIWNAIGQQALRWMLVKRKPINLGFCTIYAVPYRVNWKSVLMKAFPKSYSCFARKRQDQIEPAMLAMGLQQSFLGKELLEMDGEKHWCQWKIEVIENKVWHQTVQAVELQRLNAGKAAYSDFISRSIGKLRDLITTSYRNFICSAGAPSARFLEGGDPGQQILVPTTRRGGISPKEMARSSGDICCDTAVDWKKPRLLSLIDDSIVAMSKLPVAERQVAKLRITGGHVDQSSGPEG